MSVEQNVSSELPADTGERIPDELLPQGVGPAWWDPEVMRVHAEAYCRNRFDHDMTVKAWVVLHLMNERQRLVEQLETLREAMLYEWRMSIVDGLDYETPDGWAFEKHPWFSLLGLSTDECMTMLRGSNPAKKQKDLLKDEGIHDAFDANAWD